MSVSLAGTWVTFGTQISEDMAEELVTMAYESGVNVFDTAEVYAAGKYVYKVILSLPVEIIYFIMLYQHHENLYASCSVSKRYKLLILLLLVMGKHSHALSIL